VPEKAPEAATKPGQVAPKAAEVETLPVPAAPMKPLTNPRKRNQVVAEADNPARGPRAETT